MSLMTHLLDKAREALRPYDVAKINSITVQAGPLANIMPAAFDFAFETLTIGTTFEGAVLIMEQLPITMQCRNCGKTKHCHHLLGHCQICGSEQLSITGGADVYLSSIDFEEAK